MTTTTAPRNLLESNRHDGPSRDAPGADPGTSPAVQAPPAGLRRQRVTIVSVFTAATAVAAALGYMPWEVPVILVVWVAGLWTSARMMRRASLSLALNVDTASYCFNAILLTAVGYYLGGSTWLAGTFYTLIVLVAGAGLPRGRAIFVAVVAWIGFTILAVGPFMGWISPRPFGLGGDGDSTFSLAVVTVVFQAVALGAVVMLQQWLVGTLRSTAHANRALIEASTDLVVVLDRSGQIHGTNAGLFHPDAANPTPLTVSIEDIVTDSHRGYLQLKLAQAFSGKRVPFEVSYKGDGGSVRWLAGTLVPLPVEDSDPRVMLIGRDMTLEHDMTAEAVVALTREATASRARMFERAMVDFVEVAERSLVGIRDRARSLRSGNASKEDAEQASSIADEAEKLRAAAKDVREWMQAVSGEHRADGGPPDATSRE